MRLGIFIPTPFRSYDRVQSAIWIRALQLIPCLKALGVDVSVNNPFRRYDAAIFHRGMLHNSLRFIKFLRVISERVYWDTCVDYFETHKASTPLQVHASRGIASIVDGICVPTEGIANSGRQFCENIFVMPDPLDLVHFSGHKKNVNLDNPVFSWSGVSVKASFLGRYSEFLDDRMVIISEKPPRLPFRYRFVPWMYATFPSALIEADVAFLPRTLDSSYNINNSSFKALVYAVSGLPVISNRLPSYELLAKDYSGMSFLEDFDESPQAALEALRFKTFDCTKVRKAYDRSLWAERLINWVFDE